GLQITATNDDAIESIENVRVTLSSPTITEGDASIAGSLFANVDIDEFEASVLNGQMTTNSNQQNQYVTLTFVEAANPKHAAAKIYDLSLQGQQGFVVQEVGF